MAKTKKLGVTATLLALLLACSLIVLIASLAMVFYSQASLVITVLTIVLGGSLLAWHIRVLIGGSGRTKSTITTNFSIALIVIGCFAMITGFGLFDVLGGRVEPTRIVLAIAGFIGLVCALIAFIRDTGQEHEARESEEKKEEPAESESDDSALESGDDVLESSDDGSLESSDDDWGLPHPSPPPSRKPNRLQRSRKATSKTPTSRSIAPSLFMKLRAPKLNRM